MEKATFDLPIKDAFAKAKRYEIKTTAEEILLRVPSFSIQKEAKKKAVPFFFRPAGILSGIGILAASASAAFFLVALNQPDAPPADISKVFHPGENHHLSDELLTFRAFSSSNGQTRFLKRLASQEEKLPELLALEGIASDFETVQGGISGLFDLDRFTSATIDHSPSCVEAFSDQYQFETRFLDGNHDIVSRIYWNAIESRQDEEESEQKLTALFDLGATQYKAEITQEKESGLEAEEEIETLLYSVDGKDEKAYRINREASFKGALSEDAYSYTIYPSLEEARKEGTFLSSFCFEIEKGDINASLEANDKETEFSAIKKFSPSHYQFAVEEYVLENGEALENQIIDLYYQEDGTRSYQNGPHTVIKP